MRLVRDRAFVVDFGQNINGWMRLARTGPAGGRLVPGDTSRPASCRPLTCCPCSPWDGVDSRGVPHGSLNHYSKGAVAAFLHRYVAGLRPTAPGYRTFEVRPRPCGSMSFATARHISPFGPIEVSWRLDGGPAVLEVLVPPGTTASVVLPGEEPRRAGPGRYRWTGTAAAGDRPAG